MTTDLSQTILAKSDQLNADDLVGRTLTIKITGVSVTTSEQPVSISYEGDNGKPYLPGKSMRRVLSHVWGLDGKKYIGRSLTLYREPSVKFGGLEVGGIRISHMSHITSPVTMALTASKANKKPFTVKPLETSTVDPEIETLKILGNAAASKGAEEYVKWKDSLVAPEKEKIKPFHAAWAKEAKRVDEEKAKAPPIPLPPVEEDDGDDEELPL